MFDPVDLMPIKGKAYVGKVALCIGTIFTKNRLNPGAKLLAVSSY